MARKPLTDAADFDDTPLDAQGGATVDVEEDEGPVQELDLPPMWKVMKLDGLDGLDQEFKVQLADRSGAQNIARLRGCTKKLVKVDGEKVADVEE